MHYVDFQVRIIIILSITILLSLRFDTAFGCSDILQLLINAQGTNNIRRRILSFNPALYPSLVAYHADDYLTTIKNLVSPQCHIISLNGTTVLLRTHHSGFQ